MINWENGFLVKDGYVEINGIRYPITMPEYSGNTPVNAENLNKMQRDLQKQIVNKFTGDFAVLKRDLDYYTNYQQQGMCFDGFYYYIASITNDTDGIGSILKIDKNNEILGRYDGIIHHANSLAIKDGILYSACCINKTSGQAVLYGDIQKFDANTMTYIETIQTNLPSLTGISFLNGEMYGLSNNNNVYKINTSTGETELYCMVEENSTGITQGFDIDNNYIYYVRSNPNCILVYNHSGEYLKKIDVGDFIPKCYPVIELEDMCLYGNELFLSIKGLLQVSSIVLDNERVPAIVVKGSLYDNTVIKFAERRDGAYQIYCNSDYEGIPDGTINRPFKYVNDAINFLKTLKNGSATIYLQGKIYDEVLYFENISGYDILIQGSGATINGAIIYDSTNSIIFNNLKINQSNAMYENEINQTYIGVWLKNSYRRKNVTFLNVSFIANGEVSGYGVLANSGYGSIVVFQSCTWDSYCEQGLQHRFTDGGYNIIINSSNMKYKIPANNYYNKYGDATITT